MFRYDPSMCCASPHHGNQKCWLDKFFSVDFIHWNLNLLTEPTSHIAVFHEVRGLLVALQKVMGVCLIILIAFLDCWPVFRMEPNPQGIFLNFSPL